MSDLSLVPPPTLFLNINETFGCGALSLVDGPELVTSFLVDHGVASMLVPSPGTAVEGGGIGELSVVGFDNVFVNELAPNPGIPPLVGLDGVSAFVLLLPADPPALDTASIKELAPNPGMPPLVVPLLPCFGGCFCGMPPPIIDK